MKETTLSIKIRHDSAISPATLAELLSKMIRIGQADAIATLEDEEGDLVTARACSALEINEPTPVSNQSSVQVKHYGAYGLEGTVLTHQFDLDDNRHESGQARMTIGEIDGNVDDFIDANGEINTNPLTGIDQVPCIHINFDADNLAVSFYKIGEQILMVPESNVSIESETQKLNGVLTEVFWIK